MTSNDPWPPLLLEPWRETRTTLHLMTQIVGKVRLGLSPRMNHWWHVPLYVSARGLSTGSIPVPGRSLELEFDMRAHELHLRSSDGQGKAIPLTDTTVSRFYHAVVHGLAALGLRPRLLARPFDPVKAGSDIPFADDTIHGAYDRGAVERFWQALIGVDRIFKLFRGRYVGKCSPVHFFWHSFDLAVTRFSGREAEVPEGADPVTREAYSHEVISAGFWPGDDNMPEAAFYAYAAPEPAGLSQEPLRPEGAWWQDTGGGSMALYHYASMREAADPEAALLEFLQSSYEAGAHRGGWPRDLDTAP